MISLSSSCFTIKYKRGYDDSEDKMTAETTSKFNIPSRYSSTIVYAESREALVEAEYATAFDYAASKSASVTERSADKILKGFLELESKTLYGVHHNGSAGNQTSTPVTDTRG